MMLTSVLIAGWVTENLNPHIGMNFASAHYLIALIGIIVISKFSNFRKEIFKVKNHA
jgi:hypothetical protein